MDTAGAVPVSSADGRRKHLKYEELIKELRRDGPRHVYLLSGEEPYYIEKAQEAILTSLLPTPEDRQDGLQVINGDMDSDDLVARINTAPFFADKNVLLIRQTNLFRQARGDAEKPKKGKRADKKESRLQEVLAAMPEFSYVIFTSTQNADKRRKLTKIVGTHGTVLESPAIRPWNIGDWLEPRLRELHLHFDREAYGYFSSAVSMMPKVSLSYLDQQLQKLALAGTNRKVTKMEMADLFTGLPGVSVFALTDAVTERKVRKALFLLQRQFEDGTYFTILVSLLARHVRRLWQVKEFERQGLRGRALAQPLGLHPFIAEKLAKSARAFSEETLKGAMLELVDADYLLKTGKAGNEVLEHVIIRLCTEK